MNVIIIAVAIFLNAQTGEQVQAVAQVDSAQECAALLNANRTPKVITGQGEHDGTWYMVAAACGAEQH